MTYKPEHPLMPLRWGGSMRERMKEIRDEGYNRLGLAKFIRKSGGREVTARYMETQARVMYRAAARAILLARGIPLRTGPTQDQELRQAPPYILFGRKA